MRETLFVVTARYMSAPLLAELAEWIGSAFLLSEQAADNDVEFLQAVWQEVGDDLRGAMKRYPLEQAASDTGYSLSPSSA
ncbi:MAG: hypothetical protein OXE75_14405 [bacterium]|nr:hypothetical protein [bacterium]